MNHLCKCLTPLGFTQLQYEETILPATLRALIEAAGPVKQPSDLIRVLQSAQPLDGLLTDVLKSVRDSAEDLWLDLSYDAHLCTNVIHDGNAIRFPARCRTFPI